MNTVKFLGFTFKLDPVAFTLPIGDGWDVYWYGILIALGFLLAFIYGMKRAPLLNINTDRLVDGVIITVPLAILGARAYYLLFYSPSEFFTSFFNIHDGGLAIYGGIIGAVIGAIISAKTRKLNFIDCLDLIAPSMFIGQAIGRWGNFFNQEAFGTNTELPWGMFSMGSSGTYEHIVAMGETSLDPTMPVHPCFLYEFILCTIGFFVLDYVIKRRRFKGQLALIYGIIYGIGRFLIEGIRTDSLMLGSLRVSQLLSAVIVIACVVAYVIIYRCTREKADTESYTSVFDSDKVDDITLSLSDVQELEQEENEEDKQNG